MFTIFIIIEPGGTASEVIPLKATRRIMRVITREVKLITCLDSIAVTVLITTIS